MEALEGMVQSIVNGSLVLLAAGTISMILVEFVKTVTRWRMRFHRYAIERWLSDQPLAPENLSRRARFRQFLEEELRVWRGDAVVPPVIQRRKSELLRLVAGGERDAEAWYDQECDALFGQLESAIQLAIDFPSRYEAAYEFIVGGPGDLPEEDAKERNDWKHLSRTLFRVMAAAGGEPGQATSGEEKLSDLTPTPDQNPDPLAIRTRLGNLASRRVEIAHRWAAWRSTRSKQFLAFTIGLVLASSYLVASGMGCLNAIAMGLLAGMVAPFAKDLTTRLTEVPLRR